MSRFSVTTPATDISLLTLAELRSAVGVSGSAQDVALAALGRAVSTAIARQCCIADDGVHPPTLLRETCTEVFRWTGCGPLKLSRRPVTSIASATESGTLLDSAGYEIVGASNLYRLTSDELSDWSAGKITVVYEAGYATPPDDLKLAASKAVAMLNTEAGRDSNLKRENIPGLIEREWWVAPSNDPLLSSEIVELLAPYRQYWI